MSETPEDRLARALALIEADELEQAAELLPSLEGPDRAEALLAIGSSAYWLERNQDALRAAESAVELSDELGSAELRAASMALLSQVIGQRGEEGDLARALQLGDEALAAWVPGARPKDLETARSLQALHLYLVGNYKRAAELGRSSGDGAIEGLALAAAGRHKEAIGVFDATIEEGRQSDSAMFTAYALNNSTAALRDLLDLEEARRRNREALELFRRVGFESGAMQSEIDLLYADVDEGDTDGAAAAWPDLWSRASAGAGFERWLAPGRLSVARAEIELKAGRAESAVEAAHEAIDIASRIARVKYDTSARVALGLALLELGKPKEAVAELRTAVGGADGLGHPPTRWRAHSALGRCSYELGDDEAAASAYGDAARIVRDFTATLDPKIAEKVIGSAPVKEILEWAG
jgi:tetratricopeptide (TPR) repeat protein